MSLPAFRISRKYGAARLIGMAFTKIRGAQRSYCLTVQWPGKLQVCVNAHLDHFRTPLAISLVFSSPEARCRTIWRPCEDGMDIADRGVGAISNRFMSLESSRARS